jgi:hypothetical protein
MVGCLCTAGTARQGTGCISLLGHLHCYRMDKTTIVSFRFDVSDATGVASVMLQAHLTSCTLP